MEESSHFGMAVLLIYRNLSKIFRNKFWGMYSICDIITYEVETLLCKLS